MPQSDIIFFYLYILAKIPPKKKFPKPVCPRILEKIKALYYKNKLFIFFQTPSSVAKLNLKQQLNDQYHHLSCINTKEPASAGEICINKQ